MDSFRQHSQTDRFANRELTLSNASYGSYPWDIFISYARADNVIDDKTTPGCITAFLRQLQRVHRDWNPEDLQIFFDGDDIRVGTDWELRIKVALRGSCTMMAFVSPHYFQSEWCHREWEFYSGHESTRPISREGVYPVYLAPAKTFEARLMKPSVTSWVEDLRSRQHIDISEFISETLSLIETADLRDRIQEVDFQIEFAKERFRRATAAPGTVDRHNPFFVGRIRELRVLKHLLSGGSVGVITAVHGLAGIGKTALANEYAHQHAADYGGGRWLLSCDGQDDLRLVFRQLATPLGVQFTQLEQEDLNLSIERILKELEKLTFAARPNRDASAACLVILDNVNRAKLLSVEGLKRVQRSAWLHLLVTTQMGPSEILFGTSDQWLSLDELSEDEGLELIESMQVGRNFASHIESAAALEIARQLGGFTLAIESVAVFLGVNPDISCQSFLLRLKSDGLLTADSVATSPEVAVRTSHREKILSAALAPVIEGLNDQERFALACAAWLPADFIPSVWLEELMRKEFPAIEEIRPGYPTRLASIIRRLLGRRLLRTTDNFEVDRPRILRMHKLVQSVVRVREDSTAVYILEVISADVERRIERLRHTWTNSDSRWELEPLRALVTEWLQTGVKSAHRAAWQIAITYHDIGDFAAAEPLLREALAGSSKALGPNDQQTLTMTHDLAGLLQDRGAYEEAKDLLNDLIARHSAQLGREHPEVIAEMTTLGIVLARSGDFSSAEKIYKNGLRAAERSLGRDAELTLNLSCNLGTLLLRTGRYTEAVTLCRRGFDGRKALLGPEHPDTLDAMANLGNLYEKLGDPDSAEPLLRLVLDMRQRILGEKHPKTLSSTSDLAILVGKVDRAAAKSLCQQALEGCDQVLGGGHPITISVRGNLAHLLWKEGDNETARILTQENLNHSKATFGTKSPLTIKCFVALGSVLSQAHDYEAAIDLFKEALVYGEMTLPPKHPLLMELLNGLGSSYFDVGNRKAAQQMFRRALVIAEHIHGGKHPVTAIVRGNLQASV